MIDHEPDPLLDPRYSWQTAKPPRRFPWRLVLGGIGLAVVVLALAWLAQAARGWRVACFVADSDRTTCVAYTAPSLPAGCPPDCFRAPLAGSHLLGLDFTLANLAAADLSRSVLWGSHFRRAVLVGADLRYVDGRYADFLAAEARNADLRRAQLAQAYLVRFHLRGADLRQADLFGADLRGADLRDARLEDAALGAAELSRVNARGADLARADLAGSVLYEASLIAANLEGANLQGADLRLADLREARLEGADLRGAWYNDTTRWPTDFDPEAAGAVFRY